MAVEHLDMGLVGGAYQSRFVYEGREIFSRYNGPPVISARTAGDMATLLAEGVPVGTQIISCHGDELGKTVDPTECFASSRKP